MNMQRKRKQIGARYFWMGFFLPLAFSLTGFILIKVWPFGDGTVLIIDSLHQYLPFYTDFHEKLTHHSSLLYSFSAGLGYNFWATYAYYLASPLNFLMVLIPKANVCDFMDLSILIRIGLAGGTFTWYLHKRDKSSGALPVAFGTMYALSFFLIGYYFNLMWLDSIAMLPLIMRGIEKICGIGDNRRLSGLSDGRMYVLSLFYALWCNYYIGWMLCIFAVLYFIVCQIEARWMGFKLFFARTLRFFWYSLLAGGTGALVLYPAYKALTASEAMQSNHFPSTLRFYDSFIDMILTHFAGIKPINISSTQVGLNAYSGVVVLILVILYLLDSRIRLREKIASMAVTAFLFLSFSLNILNYSWHGFHQQNGLPNRFAFIYTAMVLTMSYDAARHLKETHLFKVILAAAIPVSFAVWALITQPGEDHTGAAYPASVYQITLLLLVGYAVLLILLRTLRLRKATAAWLLSAAFIFEAGASAIWGIGCNDSVTRSIYLNDQKSYQVLTREMNDDTWYRSEVDSQRMRDVTMFCGGNAVVMFNSTMMESVTNFCDRIGMEARTNKNGYNGVTKLMNDVLGIKYVLSSNGKGSSLYQFQKVSGDGNLSIFKNEDALALGFMVNSEITDWDIEAGTPIDVQNQFVVLATGQEPIYTLDRYITMKDDEENGIRIPENKQVYVYLPSRAAEIRLTTPEYKKTYTTFTDHLYVIASCDGNYSASFTADLNQGTEQTAIVYTCPDALEKAVVDQLSEHQLTDVFAEGNRLQGKVTAEKEGILLLTIPYDESWQVKVDGEEAKALMIGSCLLGIPLSAGAHEISMKYVPEGLSFGALVSGISLLLLLLTLYLARRRRKQEMEEDGNGLSKEILDALSDIAGADAVRLEESMKLHTTFRIGGPADAVVFPGSVEELIRVLDLLRDRDIPHYVCGNGSDLLFSDRGYRGVVVILRRMNQIEVHGTSITAEAGAMLSLVARIAAEAGLSGMEEVSGIPGTLGGALFMNAGAYGREMKDITRKVEVLDPDGEILELDGADMEFGYRTSAVQTGGYIVLSATLSLTPSAKEEIRDRMEDYRERRNQKQPLDLPSAGSTFKRPEGHFAGKLIDEAGLRGFSIGGAAVSEKHCGFIVNTGDATAEDVRDLISYVQEKVLETSGVLLEPEVRMAGF